MSLLDNFTVFNFKEGVPYVSITTNGFTFNRSVVMKLNYPNNVLLLLNIEEQQIAIVPCDEAEENATSFYKPKKSEIISVRWNGKDLLNTLQDMMGWDLSKQTYKVEGYHLKEENAMLFDFKKATVLA